MKKLYFKVYQDKHNMDSSYVCSFEHVRMICDDVGNGEFIFDGEFEESIPVFEPVFMTEEEFKLLPEFTGF